MCTIRYECARLGTIRYECARLGTIRYDFLLIASILTISGLKPIRFPLHRPARQTLIGFAFASASLRLRG